MNPKTFEEMIEELTSGGDFRTQSPGGPQVAPLPGPRAGMGDLTREDRADSVPVAGQRSLTRRAPAVTQEKQITYDVGQMPAAPPGFDDELRRARKEERGAGSNALAFQAFDQIAKAGIGGLNATDNSYWQNVAENGRGALSDVKSRRENVSKEISDRLARRNSEKSGLEVDRLRELQDPNSGASNVARAIAKRRLQASGGDPRLLDTATGADIQDVEHGLTGLESAATRKQAAALAAGEKKATRDEKKLATAREVSERSSNIETNLASLEQMIGENGTWEALGSHNQDLDRKIDQIATDMAKLQDPDSVARPAEVDLIKRGLVESGFGNRNSTALNILRNFRGEMKSRVANAYQIRGLTQPTGTAPPRGNAGVAPSGPKPGSVEDGHRFKGGDPSDPKNWEIVR